MLGAIIISTNLECVLVVSTGEHRRDPLQPVPSHWDTGHRRYQLHPHQKLPSVMGDYIAQVAHPPRDGVWSMTDDSRA